jgi:WXG100 family type VII secretion target
MALRTTAQSGGASAGGGAFATDLHVMDSSVQYVREIGDSMTATVHRMFAEVEAELNAGTWQGEASLAFARAKEEWGIAHRRHVAALENIANGLHSSRTAYQQTEQDNTDGIVKAAQGLTG